MRTLHCCLAVLFCVTAVFAGDPKIAPTPPMGWNSWDSYGRQITEAQTRQIADWMATHLRSTGWQYLVLDEGWYIANPEGPDAKSYQLMMDANGRLVPATSHFPSAASNAGFNPLADYIHSRGLKFGIHIMRGIPREAASKNLLIADSKFRAADAADTSSTCPWNIYNFGVKDNDAGQAYYDSIVRLYASWGVDYIKADCIADHPYKPDEIRMLHNAIRKSGRPIVLSLSPGPTALENATAVARYAEMWRITDDFWDHWGVWKGFEWSQGLRAQFETMARWQGKAAPGAWPDADMLPLGRLGPHPGAGEVRDTKLTRDEQRTVMTLWSIFRSPLIFGGDPLSVDDWTLSLLINPEVIAVDQHSRDNRQALARNDIIVWTARPEDGAGYYVAVFNAADSAQPVKLSWPDLGLPARAYHMRDLWERRDIAPASELKVTLAPHASALYRVSMK